MAALKNPNSLYDAYEKLAQAIILSAVEDYRSTLRFRKRFKDREKFMSKCDDELFFRSDWFKTLTTVDGEYLIKKLRKEVWESE